MGRTIHGVASSRTSSRFLREFAILVENRCLFAAMYVMMSTGPICTAVFAIDTAQSVCLRIYTAVICKNIDPCLSLNPCSHQIFRSPTAASYSRRHCGLPPRSSITSSRFPPPAGESIDVRVYFSVGSMEPPPLCHDPTPMFPGKVTASTRGRVELSSDGVGLLALGKVPQGLRYRWATDGVFEVLCILKVHRSTAAASMWQSLSHFGRVTLLNHAV